jgi:hypothetical protein
MTRQNALDRLMAQGRWIDTEIDGNKAPAFVMPTPELQDELDAALDKKIRQRLTKSGLPPPAGADTVCILRVSVVASDSAK